MFSLEKVFSAPSDSPLCPPSSGSAPNSSAPPTATSSATPAPGTSTPKRTCALKVCLHGTSDDFITVHHELGHIYYFRAYEKQPFLFQNGANDGFHEAIGDAIALSITPEYLTKIGLIKQAPPPQADLPLLLHKALDKIAFLPFGLLIDKWRWQVFSGEVKPANYNAAWWTLREKYQGVAPPVARTEADLRPPAPNITSPPTHPTPATSSPPSINSSSTAPCAAPPATPAL